MKNKKFEDLAAKLNDFESQLSSVEALVKTKDWFASDRTPLLSEKYDKAFPKLSAGAKPKLKHRF